MPFDLKIIKRGQFIFLAFCLFIFNSVLFSQNLRPVKKALPDTTAFIIQPDTTRLDTSVAPKIENTPGNQLESPIYYWAENIRLSKKNNRIYLEDKAKLVYENMTLTAARIMIDQNGHFLLAEGKIDTVDSLGNPVYYDEPVFTEKGEKPMYGTKLHYDYKTKRGRIQQGKTQMPPGYYKGSRIHKISANTLLVQDGYFTSCEYIDDPHFYFRSSEMRVLLRDKIVARPVYFYIADVPLMAIPFGVFPNKRGRRSGLMLPSYGQSTYGGRFLQDFGYYWAPNDYMDASLYSSYYDKLGFTYRADMNYTIRYILNGRIAGKYFPKDPGSGKRKDAWSFSVSHRQNIDPTMSLNISGRFQSDKNFEKNYNSNINDRLNQILTSNLTLNKRFKGTKNSMSANISRTENLQNGNINYTFPNISFSRSQSSIYETITGESGRGQKNWYQEIYFSYNSRLLNRGSRKIQSDSTYLENEDHGITHNLSFSAPQKVLKYFNLNPQVSYNEIWVDKTTDAYLDEETNSVVEKQRRQIAARRTFNSSLSLKTTIYGLFEPNLFNLKLVRHKIDPQISMTFTPDFSSPYYGYFTNLRDTTGKQIKVDKFKNNLFGSTPTRESQNLNYSVSNLFQGKLVDGENEKKVDLFTLNFSGGYDFKADSLNWRDLSSSFRASPIQKLSLNVNTSHSFYRAGPGGSGVVDQFLLSEGNLPRLKSVQAGMSFSLSDKELVALFQKKEEKKEQENEDEAVQEEDDRNEGILETEDLDLRDSNEFEKKGKSQSGFSWGSSFNLNYRYDRNNIHNPDERIDLNVDNRIQLSKNWRVNWRLRYDVAEHVLTYQGFSIYRDLHCWEMSFDWQPTFGIYKLQINIKSSVLKDIKVTKRPAGRAAY